VVGRYRVVRMLGRGSVGTVFEVDAVDAVPGAPTLALKVLGPAAARNAAMVARFGREGEAASRVRHPHVVDVVETGVADGVPYLAMERLEGEDLARLIAREGPLTVARTIALALPVLSVLIAAHTQGIVHRDLKPENVFVLATPPAGGAAPFPKVLDFGISKFLDASIDNALTRTSDLIGTPYYMSPEQTAGAKHVDARTDQYAMGVIVYECLTGAKPFDGNTIFDLLSAIVRSQPRAPSAVRPELPPALDAVVLRALAREATARFDSVAAFGLALLPFADEPTRARWEPEFRAA
jgi:serine/threonine-protein kinase